MPCSWIALFVVATVLPATIYGTYSSYRFVEESGDLIGMEVVVLPGSKHPEIIFQCAEGAPGEAVLATVTVLDNLLLFDVPPENMCGGHYQAQLTHDGLRIAGDHQEKPEVLPRRKSYWAPHTKTTPSKATSPR